MKQLVLLLPDAGISYLARIDGKNVSMDIAEGVADLLNDKGEGPVGAIAEIDRQRIEGVAKQPGIAQKQQASAGQVDDVLLGAPLRVSTQG